VLVPLYRGVTERLARQASSSNQPIEMTLAVRVHLLEVALAESRGRPRTVRVPRLPRALRPARHAVRPGAAAEFSDNHHAFAALGKAGSSPATRSGLAADVLHLHDWQAAPQRSTRGSRSCRR